MFQLVFFQLEYLIANSCNLLLTDCCGLQDSDGEKSDDNLVVDVSNEVSMF